MLSLRAATFALTALMSMVPVLAGGPECAMGGPSGRCVCKHEAAEAPPYDALTRRPCCAAADLVDATPLPAGVVAPGPDAPAPRALLALPVTAPQPHLVVVAGVASAATARAGPIPILAQRCVLLI